MKIWDVQRALFHKFRGTKEVPTRSELLESLQMIGGGSVEKRDSDSFKYSEFWEDKEIVVYGFFAKDQAYERVYGYEIQVYYADEKPTRSPQIGGGYGASGIIFVGRNKLMGAMGDAYDKHCISKVVEEVKNTLEKLIEVYNQN